MDASETQADSAAALPRVVIVGRPNVGKSTLLNRMCGSRVAIVEPTAGVTRDRIAVPARLNTPDGVRWFEVVDTGGIGIVDRDDLGPHVEGQVQLALDKAHLVLFMVDVRSGIMHLDKTVAKIVRALDVPILLVVNKTEGEKLHWDVDVFRRLGIHGEPIAISAQNGEGLTELYAQIHAACPEAPSSRPPGADAMKIAIIGRRNAGKSTLVNHLAHEERVIVSEVPGTTRDAIDVLFERDGENFVAIDTAGLRKRGKQDDAIEFFSEARSKKTIRRADVVVLMFDVSRTISAIEKSLATYAYDHHKPVILAANKWDLVQDKDPEDFRRYLDSQLPGLSFAPIVFLTANQGWNVEETLSICKDLYAQARQKVTTGELNRVLKRALESRGPSKAGHSVRIRYATQTGVAPPTFMIFVNDKKRISKDYLRYLQNQIRKELPFDEVPMRIILRDGRSDPEGDSVR
jgi:GTP-binding protein